MDTCLDSLELTANEIKAAKREVEEMAYYKWQAAGLLRIRQPTHLLAASRNWSGSNIAMFQTGTRRVIAGGIGMVLSRPE